MNSGRTRRRCFLTELQLQLHEAYPGDGAGARAPCISSIIGQIDYVTTTTNSPQRTNCRKMPPCPSGSKRKLPMAAQQRGGKRPRQHNRQGTRDATLRSGGGANLPRRHPAEAAAVTAPAFPQGRWGSAPIDLPVHFIDEKRVTTDEHGRGGAAEPRRLREILMTPRRARGGQPARRPNPEQAAAAAQEGHKVHGGLSVKLEDLAAGGKELRKSRWDSSQGTVVEGLNFVEDDVVEGAAGRLFGTDVCKEPKTPPCAHRQETPAAANRGAPAAAPSLLQSLRSWRGPAQLGSTLSLPLVSLNRGPRLSVFSSSSRLRVRADPVAAPFFPLRKARFPVLYKPPPRPLNPQPKPSQPSAAAQTLAPPPCCCRAKLAAELRVKPPRHHPHHGRAAIVAAGLFHCQNGFPVVPASSQALNRRKPSFLGPDFPTPASLRPSAAARRRRSVTGSLVRFQPPDLDPTAKIRCRRILYRSASSPHALDALTMEAKGVRHVMLPHTFHFVFICVYLERERASPWIPRFFDGGYCPPPCYRGHVSMVNVSKACEDRSHYGELPSWASIKRPSRSPVTYRLYPANHRIKLQFLRAPPARFTDRGRFAKIIAHPQIPSHKYTRRGRRSPPAPLPCPQSRPHSLHYLPSLSPSASPATSPISGTAMAPIAVGDSLPDGQLGWFDENDQLQQVSVHALAAGKKVILFGVPGAFTPTCRSQPTSPSHFLGDPLAFWLYMWLRFGGNGTGTGVSVVSFGGKSF
ncbi:hypothetical protein HU200_047214 [Digitaria exilis]|uniref:glutaredoxin-dependent peroxiredoxin n=1 Tax=Digitaria exilis TaxID=1010633 RepID=A0A835B2Y4_9POAL|nr:hypothetical protein HU200_047214 [Digitaria exilis]